MSDEHGTDLIEESVHELSVRGEAAGEEPCHVIARFGDETVERHCDVPKHFAQDNLLPSGPIQRSWSGPRFSPVLTIHPHKY